MMDFNREEKQYSIGHYDLRPWGCWVVTGISTPAETGFCEKIICVAPGKILSLQSHSLRHESWTVLAGSLRVIIDDKSLVLTPGQQVDVPKGAVHCMANTGSELCIVKERQTGICLESDIVRYMDAYGRASGERKRQAIPGISLYLDLLEQIEGEQKLYA